MTNDQIEQETLAFEAAYIEAYPIGVDLQHKRISEAAWMLCAESKQAGIDALKRELAEADEFGLGVELALADVPYIGSHVERIRRIVKEWTEAREHDRAAEDDLIELADTEWWMESMREEFSENAPWLSAAHTLCTDAGVPQGHITERIEALRGLVESLRKDAERYRWLRHGCDKKQSTATRIAQCLYGMEWDTAIDTAMAKEGK